MRPRVGFVSLGSVIGAFGMADSATALEKLDSTRANVLKEIETLEIDVIEPINRTIVSVEEAWKVAEILKRKGIDLVLLFFCSWSNEQLPSAIAAELIDCPILLWGAPEPAELASPCGVLASGTNMTRQGFNFKYLIGSAKSKTTMNKILKIARAAAIAKRLRRTRIGIVGYPPPGMIDVTYGEAELKKIGPQLVHLDLAELLMRYEKTSIEKSKDLADKISKELRISPDLTQTEIAEASRLYLALKEMEESHKLDGVSVRCWPELWERGLPICFALSKLGDEGICTGCENDLTMVVTQLAMQWFTDSPILNVDIGSLDYEQNTMFLFHCGAAATKLAQSLQEVELRRHGMACRGVEVNLEMKRGRATLAKLAGPVDGKFKMVITRGEVVKSPPSSGHYALVKLDPPVEKVMDTFIKECAGHHVAIAHGDTQEELFELCHIMKIEAVLI